MKFFILALCAVLLFPIESFANTDADIVTRIINQFQDQADTWHNIAKVAATKMFFAIAVFELCYIGIMAAIGKQDIGETLQKLILMILATAFFYACVNNYQEWSKMLIMQFQDIAGDMIKLENNSSNPFQVGLELIKKITLKVEQISWKKFGLIVAMYIASFIILICFSVITAKIIVIKCEAIIAMMAALFLLPLGASQLFREYAINSLRYVFSVTFKLFSLQLVIGVGFGFIDSFRMVDADMATIAVILGFSVVLLAVSTTIPDTVAGVINGSHAGSGAGLGSTLKMVGATTVGAIAGGVGGAVAGYRAGQIAKASGAKGAWGMAKGTFGVIRQASHQANLRRTGIATEIKDRLNTIKEL